MRTRPLLGSMALIGLTLVGCETPNGHDFGGNDCVIDIRPDGDEKFTVEYALEESSITFAFTPGSGQVVHIGNAGGKELDSTAIAPGDTATFKVKRTDLFELELVLNHVTHSFSTYAGSGTYGEVTKFTPPYSSPGPRHGITEVNFDVRGLRGKFTLLGTY